MEITSQEIINTYEKHKRLMLNLTRKYRQFLSQDEIYSCQLFAIYQALGEYVENGTIKFSTYLSNKIRWRICEVIKKEIRFKKKHQLCQNVPDKNFTPEFDVIDFKEDTKNYRNSEIGMDRLVLNMSFAEIGKKRNMCKETARQRFREFTEDFMSNSV